MGVRAGRILDAAMPGSGGSARAASASPIGALLVAAARRMLRFLAPALLLALAGLVLGPLALSPAMAVAPPGVPVSDPNPPGSDTEATIVALINTSGLYGGTVAAVSATTPYPSTGLQDLRSVTTAQLLLDDPATAGQEQILTYCIDISTDTTVGVHYRLGTWTAASVPNLPYVQWILQNYYPNVPTPSGTPAEKVRAVQGAIWYFTDQFVVSPGYPAERDAVRAIVDAAQAGAGPAQVDPQPPRLTVSPAALTGGVSGALVGPYTVTVTGTLASAITATSANTTVYHDAAGTRPVTNSDPVLPGDQLWARYDSAVGSQGFTLSASAAISTGSVYLYDGNNPPRRSAQKLVLAQNTVETVRGSASILPPDPGTLQIDVVVAGSAAGQQDQIQVTATCDAGLTASLRFVRYVPAASPAGTYSFTIAGIPAVATTCAVTQDLDGATAGTRVASTIVPPSVQLAPASTRTITVTDVYTASPGPVPTPAVLPATGATQVLAGLAIGAALIATGSALGALAVRRAHRG